MLSLIIMVGTVVATLFTGPIGLFTGVFIFWLYSLTF